MSSLIFETLLSNYSLYFWRPFCYLHCWWCCCGGSQSYQDQESQY